MNLKAKIGICLVAITICMLVPSCGTAKINGDVRYKTLLGTVWSFQIQNNDTFDWTDVHMILNKVYVHEEDIIPAGETRVAYPSEFVNPSGTEFDSYTTVTKTFSIECQTPSGKGKGDWHFES